MGLDKDWKIRILEKNVADLQMQLASANKRITELLESQYDQNSRKNAKGTDCCL